MNALLRAIAIALPILVIGEPILCSQGLPAPAASRSTGLYEIAGVVLNARTGLPIRDAQIIVRRSKDASLVVRTATDSEGRFSIPQLAGDKYSLQASHRGYIGAAYEEHDTGSTAIVTGEGLVSTGLRFMLAPQAVIFGVITDDSGDPAPNAVVSLFRLNPGAGPGKMLRMRGAGTDEQGNYEISHLSPGSYYLSVTATPWYASYRSPQNSAQAKSGHSQSRTPLDVAYPAAYYPDASDSSFAAPIVVGAGERVPINVTLHPVPALHISMPMPTINGQTSMPQLHREIFGNSDPVQANVTSTSPSEPSGSRSVTTVEISGIAPGAYEMELNDPNGESSRVAAADLNSDQAIDVSSAMPLVDVTGKVAMAGGEAPPSSLFVRLAPKQGQEEITAPIEPDRSFHLRSLRPGTYEFSVQVFAYPMTITHLTAAGATFKDHLLTIGSEPVTLTAELTESSATVNGFATQNGKRASGIFLELIPKNATAGRAAFAVNQSDSDGSFNFRHTLPGDYTLVAIQEGWTLDWMDPAAMAPYLAKGLKVSVPPHSQEINLKDSVEVQPK